MATVRIATRQSALALWQANHVGHLLKANWPHINIEIIPLLTTGDKLQAQTLQDHGGKGLFVKELEEALLTKKADLAVHSMKDVPAHCPEGLSLAAICKRHNPLDALVSANYTSFHALPEGALIGTASLRRQSQILSLRPDLKVMPLRGNVNTRLRKMEAGEFDAIILAVAGLDRLGMTSYIRETFTPEMMLPACGQGAIGIECRTDDSAIQRLVHPLNDALTALCVQTERRVNARLGGNCRAPIAVYCKPLEPSHLTVHVRVGKSDGSLLLETTEQGTSEKAPDLADRCVQKLLANGAAELLAAFHE